MSQYTTVKFSNPTLIRVKTSDFKIQLICAVSWSPIKYE